MSLELLLRRVSVGKRAAVAAAVLLLPMTVLLAVSVLVLQGEESQVQEAIDAAVSGLVPLTTLEYDLQRALTDELEAQSGESVPDFGSLTSSIDRTFSQLQSNTARQEVPAHSIQSARKAWKTARPTIERLVEQVRPLRVNPTSGRQDEVRAELMRAVKDVEQARIHLSNAVKAQYADAVRDERTQLRRLVWLWMATLGVAAVVIAALVYSIVRPVRALGVAARKLGEGRFAVRVDSRGSDELASVSGYFNTMAARLDLNRRALEAEALQDPLTRLPNRRAITAALDSALAIGQAQGQPVSVLMIDADRFKSINDRFGHAAGDEALSWLADAMRGALREEDLVGRYAGDEFLAILPNTNGEAGGQIAERLCRIVNDGAAHDERKPGITVGVAASPDNGTEAAALIDAADGALYQGKHGGRGHSFPAAGR